MQSENRRLVNRSMVVSSSSVSFIIIALLVGVGSQTMEYMTTRYDIYYGPSNVDRLEVMNCSYVVVGGFLKERCLINNDWYYKCSNSYRFYRATRRTCFETAFNRVCPNDTTFYQACGFSQNICMENRDDLPSETKRIHESLLDEDVAVCGVLVCQVEPDYRGATPIRGNPFLIGQILGDTTPRREGVVIHPSSFLCDNSEVMCSNTINGHTLNRYVCNVTERPAYKCLDSRAQKLRKDQICDNECDCYDCDDEAACNNMTIGFFCIKYSQERVYDGISEPIYVGAHQVCDSVPDCQSEVDEKWGCDNSDEVCLTSNHRLSFKAFVDSMQQQNYSTNGKVWRKLTPRSKCSVTQFRRGQRLRLLKMVCSDYRDQMNCSGSTISPLVCNVDGYPTTISEYVICEGLGLCDDNIDNECVHANPSCKIHKHRLCDGIQDCRTGEDEGHFFCKDLFPDSTSANYCIRRFSRSNLKTKYPNRWILDGIADCRNNVDEIPEYWTKRCGFGSLNIYMAAHKGKSECVQVTQFRCPLGSMKINLDRLCLGNTLNNCDAHVCMAARKDYFLHINSKVENEVRVDGTKRMHYCLPGLKKLERHAGQCSYERLLHQKKVIGVPDIHVLSSGIFAKSYVQCTEIYGEIYVYLACTGMCGDFFEFCPLIRSAKVSQCLNYPSSKYVLSLAEDDKLALAIGDGKSYSKAYFSCNNSRCITLDRVCNTVDDCGDSTDEETCSNNFKCSRSREYIPLTSKCDGKFDCFDYTDECNDECSNQVRMFDHISIKIVAWIFGVLATLLNAFTFIYGMHQYRKLKTENALVNKSFVLLVTFGDLLQGLFLLMLSIGEQFFNKSTCTTQFEWTTSRLCTALGVLSTVGSLVSLYSMTVLSIIRASKVRSMIKPREGLSRRQILSLAATISLILLISIFIALFPIVALEDYFVERLNYLNNPLFVGAPNKVQHLKIVDSYYGRIHRDALKATMPWKTLRHLVKGIFANNEIFGMNIGFYGSNGFCLFSYFVRKRTPFRWFSIAILSTNLVCVLIIVVCYIVITVFSFKVSQSVASSTQSHASKNNKKLQRKITIIILTDVLTWLPFIFVCIINYTELIDTSSWYSVFCIFFLPINSIINPIGIYDETVYNWLKNSVKNIKARIGSAWTFLKGLLPAKPVRPITEKIEMDVISVKGLRPTERKPEKCQS